MALTCGAPPGEATHWTGRAMAAAVDSGLSSVQRIWRAHRLQPHRLRTFKRSNDPDFAAKLSDIVGLYMDPPAHAVVLSIDEKTQIQALEPAGPAAQTRQVRDDDPRLQAQRHDTLFAALNVLDGTVFGRCMQRHRHQEFLRFLNAVERDIPAGKIDPRDPRQQRHPQASQGKRLARPASALDSSTSRPTSGSWLNAVEGFFSALTRRRLRRGVFRSIADLRATINRYLKDHNDDPKPFVWTKSAEASSQLNRLPVSSV